MDTCVKCGLRDTCTYSHEGKTYCPGCSPDDGVMTIYYRADDGTVTPAAITKREYLKEWEDALCKEEEAEEATLEERDAFNDLLGDIEIDL